MFSNKNILIVALIVFFLSGLSGCVNLDKPKLDRKYYSLKLERVDTASHKTLDKKVIVRRTQVSPRYEGRELVYRTGEFEYESDYFNSYFVSPSSMLSEELKKWMTRSHLFKNVLSPDSLSMADYVLESSVTSLYGDYSSENPEAVIIMQFYVLDSSKGNMPIVFSSSFDKRIPIKGSGAVALVDAINSGLTEIYKELEAQLANEIEQ